MAKKIVDDIKNVIRGRKKKKVEYPYSASEDAIKLAVDKGDLVERVDQIAELHKRIDRIIAAHESCKNLKGL